MAQQPNIAPPPAAKPTVTVQAVSFEEFALRERLPFPAPMVEVGSHRGNFVFWWKQLQFVYHLPDPARFPALGPFPQAESEVLRRYVHICEQLAKSRLINYPVTWELVLGGPEDDASRIDRPDDEALRGVLAAFRQAHQDSESASFRVAKNILSRRASVCGETDAVAQTRAWAAAQKGLFEAPLPRIVESVAFARQTRRERDPVIIQPSAKPDAILRTFLYGDYLHYGDHAAERARLQDSAVAEVMAMSDLLDIVCAFSHLYMGFGCLVNAALRGRGGVFGTPSY